MGLNKNVTVPLVEKAMSIVYGKHKQPQQVHYAEVVAELKCKEEGLAPGSYTKEQVRVSVGRALKALVGSGDMINEGKFFWGLEEYDDYCGREAFKRYVIPERKEVAYLFPCSFVIKLKSADNPDKINESVRRLFKKDNIFTSFVCDNALVIVFLDGDVHDYNELVVDAVNQAYIYHNKKHHVYDEE